jgi:hypothetical protein
VNRSLPSLFKEVAMRSVFAVIALSVATATQVNPGCADEPPSIPMAQFERPKVAFTGKRPDTRMVIVQELTRALESAKDDETVEAVVRTLDDYKPEAAEAIPALVRSLVRLNLMRDSINFPPVRSEKNRTLQLARALMKSVDQASSASMVKTTGTEATSELGTASWPVAKSYTSVPGGAIYAQPTQATVPGGATYALPAQATVPGGATYALPAQATVPPADASTRAQSPSTATSGSTSATSDNSWTTGPVGSKLEANLISLMNEAKATDKFLFTASILAATTEQPDEALMAVLRKADTLGLLDKVAKKSQDDPAARVLNDNRPKTGTR